MDKGIVKNILMVTLMTFEAKHLYKIYDSFSILNKKKKK